MKFSRLGAGDFFEKSGLLFLPTSEVAGEGQPASLTSAAPLLEIMAGDPSIRGLTGALETGLPGGGAGKSRWTARRGRSARWPRPLRASSIPVPERFPGGNWLGDKPLTDSRPPRLHRGQADPRFQRVSSPARTPPTPSGRPRRTLIWRVNIGARVRLTGPVPIANEEFATVQDGAVEQRHRDGVDRAGHSLDGPALGQDHSRRLRQPVCRAVRSRPRWA